MNQKELETKLHREGIMRSAYALDGESPYEQYAIQNNYGKWSVFYSERGLESNLKKFNNESDACVYLYKCLTKDPTTK